LKNAVVENRPQPPNWKIAHKKKYAAQKLDLLFFEFVVQFGF
jgi:hypothetical protein